MDADTLDSASALDGDACYRAVLGRDARFDGRFFTGVASTGVYCRPVCPARTPKRENCRFFACAAAAEEAGFRPCLRCRPETVPGTPAWLGSASTVSRALQLIEGGALEAGSVADLAGRLGVGPRQLRRLFRERLGTTPQRVAATRRAHFAKRLLEQSELPITEVAFAAGYGSVRRFNAAVLASFGRAPRELRRGRGASTSAGELCLELPCRGPLDPLWPWRWWGARPAEGVEAVELHADSGAYRRAACVGDFRGVISLEALPAKGASSRPRALLRAPLEAASVLPELVRRARNLADLDADVEAIAAALAAVPALRPLVERFGAPRVPGAWDPFEVAVRAILGQQVSVAAAATLAGKLAARWGAPVEDGEGGRWRCFPSAETLAAAELEELPMPKARIRALRALVQAVAQGELSLDPAGDPRSAREALEALPGVGPWTASIVALFALRDPDALPAGDLVLRKGLASATGELPSAREVEEALEAVRPWRGYAAMLLWRAAAAERR